MKEHKVLQFISHKLEHDRALSKYSDYYRKFKINKTPFDADILVSLKNWMENHLIKKDFQLQSYMTKN